MRTLIFFFLLFSISCQDSPPLISKVRNCCETEPILATVGTGNVYVPNIFTPDADGINDNLVVFANSGISQIKKIEVKKGLKVVFSATDFPVNSSNNAWDGTVDGKVAKGLFSIELEIVDDAGVTQNLQGKVCSVPCRNNDDIDKTFKNIESCKFGIQHNGAGGHDASLPSFEVFGCLE